MQIEKGQVAVVTGAGGGIGLSLAKPNEVFLLPQRVPGHRYIDGVALESVRRVPRDDYRSVRADTKWPN